jgi:hypothetical protein
MFEKEKFSFNATGVAVIPNVLTPEQIQAARESISSRWPSGGLWKFPILHLGRVFWDMMTRPACLDFCTEFVGEHFRMDHAFGVSGEAAEAQMHGGPYSSQNSCFYLPLPGQRKGFVGQLNLGFTLYGQDAETGGFCYIPGSHKSTDMRAGAEILKEVYNYDFNHSSIVVPTLKPGDLLVFTEALIHGDTGWRSPATPRMQAYYKMTPGFMCWRDPQENVKYRIYAKTDLEKKLLNPPWTGRYTEDAFTMGITNERRQPTLE